MNVDEVEMMRRSMVSPDSSPTTPAEPLRPSPNGGWDVFAPVLIFPAATSLIAVGYALGDVPLPESFQFIFAFGQAFLVVFWVLFDVRRRGSWPCYDFEWFVAATWIVSVPVYLLWTRGWKAIPLGLLLLATLLLPQLVYEVLWTAGPYSD